MVNAEYLKNLNNAQKEAVMHLDGPLLIVAGAGSGKTKVLTTRIANIIKERASVVVDEIDENAKHGVIIVKAGTKTEYDDCEWLKEISDQVQVELGESYVTTYAQSHYGVPEIDERTNYLIQNHDIKEITFVPYVFFPGLILQRNIMGNIKKYQEHFNNVEFSIIPL